MGLEIITKEDLQQFRLQLLNDIQHILKPTEAQFTRPWLKNSEVRKLLNISANTVQRLRVTGKLPSRKVGGIHYFRYEDIENLLNNDASKRSR